MGQSSHVDEPAAEANVPFAHEVHVVLPTLGLYLPAEQVLHVIVLLDAEYCPAEQFRQLCQPCSSQTQQDDTNTQKITQSVPESRVVILSDMYTFHTGAI